MRAQRAKDVYYSTCMAVCPWSKQDRTVLHEVAHHFGIGDDRLDELGAY